MCKTHNIDNQYIIKVYILYCRFKKILHKFCFIPELEYIGMINSKGGKKLFTYI